MERRIFTVGCDLDDSIEYLIEAWITYLNNKYQLNVKYENVKHWDMSKSFPTLTEKEIVEPLFMDSFWETVKPMPDAVEYLKKLMDDGHQVYICTNSHYKTLASKMDNVLFKYFPFITWDNVIICKNKQMIKCDYLIDDGSHNIVGDYKGLLINTPYNENFDETKYPNVRRVYSWKQIYNIINNEACN